MNRYLIIILTIVLAVSSIPLFSDGNRGVQTTVEEPDPDLKVGKQYLAVIAISEYEQWIPLHSPVEDAKEIKDIITSRYYIDKVYELYDREATKANIMKLFVKLQEELGIDDSLLILYSGHGHLDKSSNSGFWIPVNAGTDVYEQHNWLPHAQLKGLIANIDSSHILVISDSCFSGDLLHTTRSIPPTINEAYFKKAYFRVSRQVLTSGAAEIVPDVSGFAYQLKSILRRNQYRFLDTLMMYNEVRLGVKSSIPLLGSLEGTGHQEGASFILFLRGDAQTDQTPFGPIHLGPGPPVATGREIRQSYLSLGIGIDHCFPVGVVAKPMDGALDLLSQFHYNRNVAWGDIGIGLVTGIIYLSTFSDNVTTGEYDLLSFPLAVNLRYMTVGASRFFLTADLMFGSMINRILFKYDRHENFTTFKPFYAPTLSIGRHLFDRWRLSVYGSYLVIMFDNDNWFTGINAGLRLEYTFGWRKHKR